MSLESWRAAYRAEQIPRRYDGRLHLALTTTVTILAAIGAISQVHAVTLPELLVVPASFLVANGGEYWGHKNPMHHPWRGLGRVYRRHALTHHRFFTDAAMLGEDARDWHVTLFPPVLLAFFFGALGAPIAGLLFVLFGANVGWLFVATVALYFLVYEWLHLAYHVAPTSWLHRLPGVAALAHHHRIHHDPRRMTRCNFNISFPVFDVLLGTREG